MKLQLAPSNSCLLAAVAMVLDMPIDEVKMTFVPHINPNEPIGDPVHGPRGYAIQDFQNLEFGFITYLLQPVNIAGEVYSTVQPDYELMTGIFFGQETGRRPHAVAWDGEKLYDPSGEVLDIESAQQKYAFSHFYRFVRIKSEKE